MDPAATRQVGRTDLAVTQLGMGSAPIGDLWERLPERQVEATFAKAYEGGVRYFDTAPWYGNTLSEHRLGHFLRQRPRSNFAVSTKVGRVLLVTCGEDAIHALDIATGEDVWRFAERRAVSPSSEPSMPPT